MIENIKPIIKRYFMNENNINEAQEKFLKNYIEQNQEWSYTPLCGFEEKIERFEILELPRDFLVRDGEVQPIIGESISKADCFIKNYSSEPKSVHETLSTLELSEYLSKNKEEEVKRNILQQIINFLLHKYPGSQIEVNEEDNLTIGKMFKNEILSDLQTFNTIRPENGGCQHKNIICSEYHQNGKCDRWMCADSYKDEGEF